MKKIVLTATLVLLLAFGSACGGRPRYSAEGDVPAGADAFSLSKVGYDFWGGGYKETLTQAPEFYPVPSYYKFGGDDKLIWLDEVRSEIDSPVLDDE